MPDLAPLISLAPYLGLVALLFALPTAVIPKAGKDD
jgi:hypothetical protein